MFSFSPFLAVCHQPSASVQYGYVWVFIISKFPSQWLLFKTLIIDICSDWVSDIFLGVSFTLCFFPPEWELGLFVGDVQKCTDQIVQ